MYGHVPAVVPEDPRRSPLLRGLDREDAPVVGPQLAAEDTPLLRRHAAAPVHVEVAEVLGHPRPRDLARGQAGVAVGVVLPGDLGERRQGLLLLVGAGHEQKPVREQRARHRHRRHAPEGPGGLPGGQVVGVDRARAVHQELPGSGGRGVQDRRRVALPARRALRAPQRLAGVLVEGQHERAESLVADHQHPIAGEDGRGRDTVEVSEGAEGVPPALAALRVVGDDSRLVEEDVDVRAVGGRGGRRGVVSWWSFAVSLRSRAWRQRTLPEERSRARVTSFPPSVAVRKMRVPGEDGGGPPERHVDGPVEVLPRAELDGQAPGGRDTRTVGSPEAGPVLGADGGGHERHERDDEPGHANGRTQHA